MNIIDEEEVLWVFVYGTLRPGEYNYDRTIKDAVRWCIQPAEVRGRLYHVLGSNDQRPIYPVAKLDEEGTIKGVLLGLDPNHPGVQHMISMELGAGYVAMATSVRYGSRVQDAAVFHYDGTRLGGLITSGDWADVSGRRG